MMKDQSYSSILITTVQIAMAGHLLILVITVNVGLGVVSRPYLSHAYEKGSVEDV